jgi:hypothetical protein
LIGFSPKGSNPFIIQTIFKFELLLEFLIQNPSRSGS